MEILQASITNMWREGKGISGELVATDEGLIFNKKGFLATYLHGGLVKGIADLASTKLFYLVLPYSDIQSGKQGRFRLNRKALIVTLKTGEEIVYAVADKHKKWFALMDEKVNCNN